MSQGHTGGRRAPARWTPAALRPQGHSHGVQLSLPLSKVPPVPPGRSPASSAPVQRELPLTGLRRGGPPALSRLPRAAGPQAWFWGVPLAGGVRATRASFLGSPSEPSPAGPREGPCCTSCFPSPAPASSRGMRGRQGWGSRGAASSERPARPRGAPGAQGPRRAGPGQGQPCHSCSACREPLPSLVPFQRPALSSSSRFVGAVAAPPRGRGASRARGTKEGRQKGARSPPLPRVPCVPRALPSPGGTAATPHRPRPRHLAVPPGGGRTLLPAPRCCSRPAGCPWRRPGCSRWMSGRDSCSAPRGRVPPLWLPEQVPLLNSFLL